MVNIGNDWDALLEKEFEQPYYKQLRTFLAQEYRTHRIYPDMYSIFNALKFTPYGSVRVVILGQDPIRVRTKRTALPFRCSRASQRPRSLQNIYQELPDGLWLLYPEQRLPKKWADQGVLLLNTSLTVRPARRTHTRTLAGSCLRTKLSRF